MKIAIFGSIDEAGFANRTQREAFITACTDIGAELARTNQTLVTLGGARRSADVYAVQGFLGVAKAMKKGQIIWVDAGDESPLGEHLRSTPDFFTVFRGNTPGWFHASLKAIELAQAVITIGGAEGVLEAGGIARGAHTLLVPIGSFKGTSNKLLSEIQKEAAEAEALEWGRLALPWGTEVCKAMVERLGIGRKPRILLIHGRSNDWSLLKDSIQNGLQLPAPLVMRQLPNEGKTLPEKWESVANRVDAAIAVVTPDDVGALVGQPEVEQRARQNTWLEVGFIWGRLGRSKFVLLIKNKVVLPSDLGGLESHGYHQTPTECFEHYKAFADRLTAGLV